MFALGPNKNVYLFLSIINSVLVLLIWFIQMFGGPYSTPTLNGFKYLLTVVDDATRATWVYLMKSKSEVRPLITSFYSMVLTQFGCKIKTLRIDNSMEFNMLHFYSSNDIIHQHSCVYTPQQNSIVERKHQHLLYIARSLHFQSIFLFNFGVIVSLLLLV